MCWNEDGKREESWQIDEHGVDLRSGDVGREKVEEEGEEKKTKKKKKKQRGRFIPCGSQ